MITAGSFSRLSVFEECKKRAHIAFVQKIREPDRGPHPKGEWPNDRGSRVHDEMEDYVIGKSDKIPVEAKSFKSELEAARRFFQQDKAYTEEMWCYTHAWVPCADNDWDNIAFRIKTDLTVFLSEEEAVIADYKTGKIYGNEVKHGWQVQLYALGAVLRYPQLKEITTEIWYVDHDELVTKTFTAKQAKRFFANWNQRNMDMMNTTVFPANPSKHNCRWCPYKPTGTGHCEVGVG